MIVSTTGVKMDPSKVSTIVDWEAPSHVKELQAFLGFSNFYRRFIRGFSRIVRPLITLTRKSVTFYWSSACQQAFESLKSYFISAPILRHFDPEREVVVECDASDYVSSGILSQYDDQGILHPVAFMSKKHDPAECNYEIYDKELLAIVRCFESWRPELQGTSYPITVITDHANLKYFMTTKQLSQRQVRWSEFLSQFDFIIKTVPGKEHGKPDAFTRRSQDLPQTEDDDRLKARYKSLLKPHNLDPKLPELSELFADASWEQEITLCPTTIEPSQPEPLDHKITRLLEKGLQQDPWFHKTRDEMLKPTGTPHSKDVTLSECRITDGRLYFRDRVYVPDSSEPEVDVPSLRTFILQTIHDSVESGHPGKNKLYELISRFYWWPKLSYDVTRFTRNCLNCARNKTSRLRYQGTLKPLPVPLQRWKDLSVDFIGPVSTTARGYNAIMVVVDRLSKDRHFIPCNTTMGAYELAMLFIRDVWKLHGLPDSIISDRGSLFISEFWKAVCYRLRIEIHLATAFHQETDGQTEVANAFLEQYLRQYVDFAAENWDEWLPLAEFAVRNIVNDTTKMSPFFANTGYYPRMSFSPPRPIQTTTPKELTLRNKEGNNFVNKMERITDLLRTNMKTAQSSQEHFANKKRSPAPAYRIGDMVLLSTRNIKLDRPVNKLKPKFIGPYRITATPNSHSYQLDLPHELSLLYNTFHVNLLRPAPDDPLPGQQNPPPPPITIDSDGEALWAIEAILDSKRTRAGTFFYLIKWRGYEETSWEPLANVIGARASVIEFERLHKGKVKPTKKELQLAREQC